MFSRYVDMKVMFMEIERAVGMDLKATVVSRILRVLQRMLDSGTVAIQCLVGKGVVSCPWAAVHSDMAICFH